MGAVAKALGWQTWKVIASARHRDGEHGRAVGSLADATTIGSITSMPTVTIRLFAGAREAAGVGSTQTEASSVAEALDWAMATFGDGFTAVLAASRVWLNGEPALEGAQLSAGDEIAVLPPVSGG
ncbi:MoaD/ThiS family protein [Candidatus Poriferisodalis sp.]|uniref:MoaD/ThiS family protein n=1 Tax=Candidatus Poriferisodalis sp. TaxID=3101277 RepID=UPI003B02E518